MVLNDRNINYASDASWHSNILQLSKDNGLITGDMETRLREFMGFRHYFRHSYGFMLDNDLLRPLYKNLSSLLAEFKDQIFK